MTYKEFKDHAELDELQKIVDTNRCVLAKKSLGSSTVVRQKTRAIQKAVQRS